MPVVVQGIEVIDDAAQPGGKLVVDAAGDKFQRYVVLVDEKMILSARP